VTGLVAADHAVIDASAAVRLLLQGSKKVAEAIRKTQTSAPSLITIEVANALATAARTGRIEPDVAERALALMLELPVELVPIESLAAPALTAAVAIGISAYDAAYLVLAAQRDAVLVTADRRLSLLAERALLVD